MFTGLVEATGKLISIQRIGNQARLLLDIPFANELALGDSVAVNGCCLTVSEITKADGDIDGDFNHDASQDMDSDTHIYFDLLEQTLRVTSLGTLQQGDVLNLERALLMSQRLGGHFMQGHVDGVGRISALEKRGQDHVVSIAIPSEIEKYCISKGSLALDGISLTIADLTTNAGETTAEFWITPHTFAHTNLSAAKLNNVVNLEADMLAKYTEKLLSAKNS